MPAPTPTPKPISTLIEEGYKQYVDSKFQFSIYYPGNWTIIPYENIPYSEVGFSPQYVVEAVNFCDPDTMEFYIPEDINRFLGRESCGYFIQVAVFAIASLEGDFTSKNQVGNYTLVGRYVALPVENYMHYQVTCSGLEEIFEKNKEICDAVVNSFTILEPMSEEEILEAQRKEPTNISNVVISKRIFLKENSCQYICDVTNHNEFSVCARVLLNYTYDGEERSEQGYTRTIEPNGTEWASFFFQESDAREKYSSDFQCTVLEMKKII